MSDSIRRRAPLSEEEQTPLTPVTQPLAISRTSGRPAHPPRGNDHSPIISHDTSDLSRRSSFHHGTSRNDSASQDAEYRLRRQESVRIPRRAVANDGQFPGRSMFSGGSEGDRATSSISRKSSRHRNAMCSLCPSPSDLGGDGLTSDSVSSKAAHQRDMIVAGKRSSTTDRCPDHSSAARPIRQMPNMATRHPQIEDSGVQDRRSVLPSRRQSYHSGVPPTAPKERSLPHEEKPVKSHRHRRAQREKRELRDEKSIQMAFSANKQRIEHLEKMVHDLSRELNDPKTTSRKAKGRPSMSKMANAAEDKKSDRPDDPTIR